VVLLLTSDESNSEELVWGYVDDLIQTEIDRMNFNEYLATLTPSKKREATKNIVYSSQSIVIVYLHELVLFKGPSKSILRIDIKDIRGAKILLDN
jgi:hypothetical protein